MTFSPEPRRASQPFLLVPWPVLFLIGLLATCYAAFALAPAALEARILADYAFIPARYSHAFLLAHGYEPGTVLDRGLPFVSYIFLHASLGHVAINSVWLLPFGTVVARRYGAIAFFIFFLLCGAAGAAFHLACNWGSALPVVGASGAISGLMGAAFRMMGPPRPAPDGFGWAPAPLAPILSPRIVVWSAVWVGINILVGVTGLGAGTEVRLIAWQAHLGGYFSGLLLAGPFAMLTGGLERGGARHR
jgi:membrane associated rhomboid family serine protease